MAVENEPFGDGSPAAVVDAALEVADWHICYLYVHPYCLEQRHNDTTNTGKQAMGKLTQPGFHTWCLLGYVVSPSGAQRLTELLDQEEIYAPIDNMVSDWRMRGLLNVKCLSDRVLDGSVPIVGNAGQLDLRVDLGGMPSNIWASTPWATVTATTAAASGDGDGG